MPDLLETQLHFFAAIRSHQDEARLLAVLAGEPGRNTELIAIYRGNAVANTLGALELAYPVCQQIVGEECFRDLSRLYWRAHPPLEGDLNVYGDGYADFIDENEFLPELPWMGDVARLEWAIHLATMAADHQAIGFGALVNLSPAQLADSVLQCQLALHLIESRWPIASIWQQHQPTHEAEMDFSGCSSEFAMVYREGLQTSVCSLSTGEAACIGVLQAGMPVSAALQAYLDSDATFDAAAFPQCAFSQQLFIRISRKETP